MAKYQRIVTTEAGLQLLAAAVAGGTITFTAIKTGSGIYTGTEDLTTVSDLKSVRQTFGVSSITRTGTQVKLRSVLSNDNLTEGYSMTEIGLYARNPDTGVDILYAIIIAEPADYLPPYETAPASITLELYIELTEAENGVTFMAEVIDGVYVPVESFNEHVASAIHITAAERTAWNAKLSTTGNVSDTTAAFTEATTLAALTTGSKLSALFGALAKAVSSLISHLANTSNPHSVTKAQVGLGNVDNTSDVNKPISTATQAELNKKALATDLTSHTGNTSNPHSVTAAQVGLGNVPNVATNDQTPTYTEASATAALTSGEKLSVALGKIAKAINSLISHLANKSNPHGVTASQAGAVPASETSNFNFTNKSLNTVNIDEVTSYNYITALSEEGHGTVPAEGWLNIINFWSSHFVTQLAFTCLSSTTPQRSVKMWMRERYMSSSAGWSEWKLIHNASTITAGTVDLAAGTSPLETGEIYFVYE